jgi:hypothetical protein
MSTSLAGHNILVLFSSTERNDVMAEGFKEFGANVFTAENAAKAVEIKDKWDIDIIVCETVFIAGVGEKAAFNSSRLSGKSAPLLFGCGPDVPSQRRQLTEMGMLKLFAPNEQPGPIADSIIPFLYDAGEHLRQLAAVNMISKITLHLQNADGKWAVQINDWNGEGAEAQVEGLSAAESTGVLTVVLPDPQETRILRFAVRWEVLSEMNNFQLRILAKDRARWEDLLSQIQSRQETINQFLLASSGR